MFKQIHYKLFRYPGSAWSHPILDMVLALPGSNTLPLPEIFSFIEQPETVLKKSPRFASFVVSV